MSLNFPHPSPLPNAPSTALPISRIRLRLPMQHAALEQFRGAVAEQAGFENEWFHNHNNEAGGGTALHYRYPLVQYHCIAGKAAIIGLGEGADALRQWMLAYKGQLHMAGKQHTADVLSYTSQNEVVQTTDEWHSYHLRNWVALNEKHFAEWQGMTRLADRLALLEQAIAAHIMAFARGIGWFVDKRLVAELTDYQGHARHRSRGAQLLAFDVDFRIQALLPDGMGLGKAASIGFGRLSRSA